MIENNVKQNLAIDCFRGFLRALSFFALSLAIFLGPSAAADMSVIASNPILQSFLAYMLPTIEKSPEEKRRALDSFLSQMQKSLSGNEMIRVDSLNQYIRMRKSPPVHLQFARAHFDSFGILHLLNIETPNVTVFDEVFNWELSQFQKLHETVADPVTPSIKAMGIPIFLWENVPELIEAAQNFRSLPERATERFGVLATPIAIFHSLAEPVFQNVVYSPAPLQRARQSILSRLQNMSDKSTEEKDQLIENLFETLETQFEQVVAQNVSSVELPNWISPEKGKLFIEQLVHPYLKGLSPRAKARIVWRFLNIAPSSEQDLVDHWPTLSDSLGPLFHVVLDNLADTPVGSEILPNRAHHAPPIAGNIQRLLSENASKLLEVTGSQFVNLESAKKTFETPFAEIWSASIRDISGEISPVNVRILRPNISERIESDRASLKKVLTAERSQLLGGLGLVHTSSMIDAVADSALRIANHSNDNEFGKTQIHFQESVAGISIRAQTERPTYIDDRIQVFQTPASSISWNEFASQYNKQDVDAVRLIIARRFLRAMFFNGNLIALPNKFWETLNIVANTHPSTGRLKSAEVSFFPVAGAAILTKSELRSLQNLLVSVRQAGTEELSLLLEGERFAQFLDGALTENQPISQDMVAIGQSMLSLQNWTGPELFQRAFRKELIRHPVQTIRYVAPIVIKSLCSKVSSSKPE